MNRRGFLKMLGIGAATAAVSPTLAFKLAKTTGVRRAVGTQAVISEYVDYASFSSMSIAAAIDPVVASAAAELGRRAGEDISTLYAQNF